MPQKDSYIQAGLKSAFKWLGKKIKNEKNSISEPVGAPVSSLDASEAVKEPLQLETIPVIVSSHIEENLEEEVYRDRAVGAIPLGYSTVLTMLCAPFQGEQLFQIADVIDKKAAYKQNALGDDLRSISEWLVFHACDKDPDLKEKVKKIINGKK